jgi:hypothetical protein
MRYIIGFLTIIIIITLIAIKLMPDQTLQIKTKTDTYDISIEIADSPEEQTLGLMWREDLPENKGMLFVYEKEDRPNFWMKNMEISLDILFINSDLKINHIEHDVQPCKTEKCERYNSPVPVQYVLELKSGFAEKYGVEIGDEVVF